MAFHKSNDKYLERTKQYDPSFNVKFYQTFLTIVLLQITTGDILVLKMTSFASLDTNNLNFVMF